MPYQLRPASNISTKKQYQVPFSVYFGSEERVRREHERKKASEHSQQV